MLLGVSGLVHGAVGDAPGGDTAIHVLQGGKDVSLASVVHRSSGTGAVSSGVQAVINCFEFEPASSAELQPRKRRATRTSECFKAMPPRRGTAKT